MKEPDVAKMMDESEATDYYYDNYLPHFDYACGSPVCLREFIENDWADIKRGK